MALIWVTVTGRAYPTKRLLYGSPCSRVALNHRKTGIRVKSKTRKGTLCKRGRIKVPATDIATKI
jgi:hypothetical protein